MWLLLIIYSSHYVATTTTIPFDSKQKCEAALKQILNVPVNISQNAVCVET